MRNVPAATPATSGKNKGNITVYSWPTAIKAEDNATGLPIVKDKVTVNISGGDFEVAQFETADEVRQSAGEHFDSFVLELANAKLAAAQLNRGRTGFAKLTLAPADIVAYVRERIATFDVASLWTPAEKAAKGSSGPRGVRAELAQLTAAADSMSKEDLLAAIMALSAKTK